MKKSYLTVLVLCLIYSCQEKKSKNIKLDGLDNAKAYLIFRGTDTKQGFFAKEFNVKDTIFSHVGFLIYDNDWLVYNVSDFDKYISALQAQTIEEFQECDDGKVTDISIWNINSEINLKPKLLSQTKKLMESKVHFDKFFKLGNNNLYCSEFVVDILRKSDSTLSFQPVKRELKGIYKSYFRKDTLVYYPVDIFIFNTNFKKIKEWKLE